MTPEQLHDIRSYTALAMNGYPFTDYTVREILNIIRLKRTLNLECCYCMMVSAAKREDRDCMFMYAVDWSEPGSLPTAPVSKFTPGKHFHCLGKKFPTFQDAERYLESQGYRFGGFIREEARFVGD